MNCAGGGESPFGEAKMEEPAGNLEIARGYLQALGRGETGAALSSFFAPDVVLEEFPNLLTPLGKRRDLAAALEGAERGKKVMSRQMYKIKQEIADNDRVALEVEWVGTLAVPFGSIPAGGQMKAFFAVFLEFREGKIIRQRNYDCFEAWLANGTEKWGS
jgi:ketosteroid isomerase-like protein